MTGCDLLPDVDRVRVSMAGRTVGALVMSPEHTLAFAYDRDWLAHGFSISPLSLPLREGVFVAKRDPLSGMFGVFDDSMPDGWGRLLTDRMLRNHGVDPYAVGPLARLSIVGRGGMGALEYEPASTVGDGSRNASDLDELAQESLRMLRAEFSDDLDTLFALGGSSGGARPKILTSIDGGEWIIKFPSSVDPPDIGLIEYRISNLARACGVDMPETRLFPSKRCAGYFGVRRFDRVRGADGVGRKVHMVSAGGLLETSHRIANLDYGLLMRLTMRMTGSAGECMRLYRLMCFNVFIGNRDDHAKNFSYLRDPEQPMWRLSPAYDLTENPGINGEHTTAVNGRGRGISVDDLVSVGVTAGIPRARCVSVAEEMRARIAGEGFAVRD